MNELEHQQSLRPRHQLTLAHAWAGMIVMLFATNGLLCHVAVAGNLVLTMNTDRSTVTDGTVRVGDVAKIEGGSTTDRRLIARLDLDAIHDGEPCLVSQRQVNTRLLLAGFSRDEFQVIGASATSVVSASPGHQSKQISSIIESQLGQQFGIDAKRIDIRLENQTQLESFVNQFEISTRTISLAPRNDFPIGRTRLQLQCIAKGTTQTSIPHQVWLDATVGLSMRVAVAKEPISRGVNITDSMFQIVDRTMTSRADFVDANSVAGRAASRYIAPGTILLANHLITTQTATQPIVRRNDLIDVVIRAGAGEIRLKNARAMEPGRAGDTIEVLNPKSGKRFNAEVVSANLATVAPAWQRSIVR
ncbi:flagellar basal body P-ring formation chaperone FlgA [Rhodopirellula sp. MGV]|uniref:flagellar basal body P-ring formation chaperone FlgA n=1 Tax=Rhodopirellula sp. MGV TaxID=2023130 RepID=UPI0013044456|nr:flagellar basal body P-ring formation chaperone FlgA [Rhodopirellula sp. MGV]